MRRSSFLEVQNLELQRILSGKAFARLVLIIWFICAVSMVIVLKNMEFIVHIKMYEYGDCSFCGGEVRENEP